MDVIFWHRKWSAGSPEEKARAKSVRVRTPFPGSQSRRKAGSFSRRNWQVVLRPCRFCGLVRAAPRTYGLVCAVDGAVVGRGIANSSTKRGSQASHQHTSIHVHAYAVRKCDVHFLADAETRNPSHRTPVRDGAGFAVCSDHSAFAVFSSAVSEVTGVPAGTIGLSRILIPKQA